MCAATNADVEDIAVCEVEDAQREFASDNLLLVRNDVEHFERIGFDQTQVEANIDDEQIAANPAICVERICVANEGVRAN